MVKSVGLSREDEKYLEIKRFRKEYEQCAAILYTNSINFYRVFNQIFGNGYQIVLGNKIPNLENLSVCLSNFHFAVELMLKALISLKQKKFDFIHNLTKLLDKVVNYYPGLSLLKEDLSSRLVLEELSKSFNIIRYGGGTICLSHNKKNDLRDSQPLKEFSEILDFIFHTLKSVFDKERV